MQLAEALYRRIQEMNSDIIIREATDRDGPEFIAMMNTYYRRKKDLSYYHWQFQHSQPSSKLFVAVQEEKVVACYGAQVLHLANGSACGFTVDLLIENDLRRRGVFVLLEKAVTEFLSDSGAVGLVSLPNPEGRNAHTWLEGWKEVGIIKTLTVSPGQMSRSMSGLAGDGLQKLSFSKSSEYLSWRFDANPVYTYTRLASDSESFAVVKIFVDPVTHLSYGDIVDVECNLDDPHAIQRAIIKACEYLFSQNVGEITIWGLPHTSTGKVARALGFRESTQERFFCVKVLKAGHEYLYDFANWHLVEADSEIY
ncbi:MAG TPA: hypothetical protein VL633_09145 [Bacteroidota bacterium]|jgi:hypothetical protein|nr:hypothetical protein [Bacteroidota bacterium]